ncbi:SirB2 family protein [Roseateles sp.]|uniref:SirB2 family protein n=1 Tax=Roseateles sp. TaxID=1971397 RepID=UPI003923C565
MVSYSFVYEMSRIHGLLAWAAVALFVLRGMAAFQFGREWAMDSRVRVLVFGLYVLLGVTGLSLWGLRHYDPLTDAWMAAKLLGLLAFAVSAYRAMAGERFHPWAYGAGLASLAYLMAVSLTREALPGL